MEHPECIICLETINHDFRRCSVCTAVYHRECILDMIEMCPLYRTCPLCRTHLPGEFQYYIQMRENSNYRIPPPILRVVVHDMRRIHTRRNCCEYFFRLLFGEDYN
jgi:hypothetical protein